MEPSRNELHSSVTHLSLETFLAEIIKQMVQLTITKNVQLKNIQPEGLDFIKPHCIERLNHYHV